MSMLRSEQLYHMHVKTYYSQHCYVNVCVCVCVHVCVHVCECMCVCVCECVLLRGGLLRIRKEWRTCICHAWGYHVTLNASFLEGNLQ